MEESEEEPDEPYPELEEEGVIGVFPPISAWPIQFILTIPTYSDILSKQ
jgi:hypothetical protein